MPKRRPRRAPSAGPPPPRAEEKSVLEITTSIAKGDPAAFALFYEDWFDRAFSLARKLTRRDESFCLDVVQDAMLRVVRSLRPMPDRGELARWMARVVRTTAIDLLRRETRRIRREARRMARCPAEAAPDPSSAAERDEAIEWVRLELGKMPDGDRLLLLERFDRGSTFEGAGRAAGMSGNAAHGRVRRALERLRGAARRVLRDGF